jgi:hypothetical protein
MTDVLHRLIYYSRNRMTGSPDELIAGIHDILTSSRRNNALARITGALMFNGGCFAQVLEGPPDAVEETFDRIQMDERHGDVVLLGVAITEERAFDRWAMAFVGTSVEDVVRYGGIADVSRYDPSQMAREELFEALHRLVLEYETR